MKYLFILVSLLPFTSLAQVAPARLRYSEEFVLQKVLEYKWQVYRPEIPRPVIHYEGQTALLFFQDIMEGQWGIRPERFSNAYSVHHNLIFLIDDASYYERTGRCIDDSLAHELVHYVQSKYQGFDLNDESLEWNAIDIQTAFREEYCK